MTTSMLVAHLRRRPPRIVVLATAVVLVATLLSGTALVLRSIMFGPRTITAYFTAAQAIYVGDDVRVAGLKVGTITQIEPEGDRTAMTLKVDHNVPVPADAKAVIVAQNLVAARYVQLTPAYQAGGGPTMADGAVIPIERTAVPVEWDDVKDQLMRLATELGPQSGASTTAVGRMINSAANAMGGNGDKLRQTLAQLSGVGRVLANGSGDITNVIRNLQTFVAALRDSNEQIVQFGDRLATLTSVLNESRSDLDAGLSDLSIAVGDIQRFVAGTRNQTAEQVGRLADVTQTLADQRQVLENILHIAPTAVANTYSAYDPATGTIPGTFVLNNFSNPIAVFCGAIGAIENITAPETAKLCAQYLGPGLSQFSLNSLPIPLNPYLIKSPDPGQLIYSEPNLAPGGGGPKPGPPEMPPAVSAYQSPDGGAGLPGPEPRAQAGLPGMLLPADTPPPSAQLGDGPPAPPAPEGTPPP